jgi:hypothetical protein
MPFVVYPLRKFSNPGLHYSSSLPYNLPIKLLSTLQQPLPGQLNLPCRFSCLETSLRNTDCLPIAELELLFVYGVRTRAVVREMDAGEGIWAKVVCAVCY